jgi:hypothetical protein
MDAILTPPWPADAILTPPWPADAILTPPWPATVPPMTEPRPSAVVQMVEQIDEKHEDGHRRLRQDLRAIEARLILFEAQLTDLRTKVTRMEAAPLDVSNLRLSPSLVIAVIMTVITLVGGFWTIKDAIGDLKKGQELQRIQIESLAKTVISLQPRSAP